jgi:hypothetical protein
MVTMESVEKQLKKIDFNPHAWGRTEVKELPHIMLDHEEITEVVNGIYDGGFALLVATNVRLLLIDKKPLNFLTVEDMRFDMINELDYSHRLIGARINISAGNKSLSFTSFNQQRLRKAIGHVQRCMAEAKKQQSDHAQDQKEHLAKINQQLQAYLLAQHQQQDTLRKQVEAVQTGKASPEDIKIEQVKPSPALSDYLLTQTLMEQIKQSGIDVSQFEQAKSPREATSGIQEAEIAGELPEHSVVSNNLPPAPSPSATPSTPQMSDLYSEGMREIFGGRHSSKAETASPTEAVVLTEPKTETPAAKTSRLPSIPNPLEINPLQIAYSKLPMALRNKKFGRPSFHAHSQQSPTDDGQTASPTQTAPATR